MVCQAASTAGVDKLTGRFSARCVGIVSPAVFLLGGGDVGMAGGLLVKLVERVIG